MRQSNWEVVELHTDGYSRLGNIQHRVRSLNTERRSNTEYRILEQRDSMGKKSYINQQCYTKLQPIVYRFSMPFIQGHAQLRLKHEPLSLIITTYPLRFLLVPTHLSVLCPLSVPPRRFILGCPLHFVLFALAFHTWSSEVANNFYLKLELFSTDLMKYMFLYVSTCAYKS